MQFRRQLWALSSLGLCSLQRIRHRMVAQGLHIAVFPLHAFPSQVSAANGSKPNGMPDLAGFGLGHHRVLPKGFNPLSAMPRHPSMQLTSSCRPVRRLTPAAVRSAQV